MTRDRTRTADRKAFTVSRRTARRIKSAHLFLAFAFPAEMAALAPTLRTLEA